MTLGEYGTLFVVVYNPKLTGAKRHGQFGVQVIVSGLETNEQADRAMAYLQSLICGKEMTVN